MYIFWSWDVYSLCISCGYTLYSYMTWICNVFDCQPWFYFIPSMGMLASVRQIVIFLDGTSWTPIPGLTCVVHWWIFVMYFGHQMILWPHTLGGICYNPKLHLTCIPGIRPSYLLFLSSHHWKLFLKNTIFEYVHAQHHYCLHLYACCTNTAHVRMLVAPL